MNLGVAIVECSSFLWSERYTVDLLNWKLFFFLSRNLYSRGRLCCCYSHYLPLPEFKLGLYVMESLCVSSKWPVAATSTTCIQRLTGRRNCEDNCVLLPGSLGDRKTMLQVWLQECTTLSYTDCCSDLSHLSPRPPYFFIYRKKLNRQLGNQTTCR